MAVVISVKREAECAVGFSNRIYAASIFVQISMTSILIV